MPTYEYACRSCGTHVEVYQRFSDPSLTECGVCGGPLRKVFHPAGILFKGSGFYATDSRSSRSSRGGDSGSGEKAAGSSRGGDRKESSASKPEGSGDAGSKPATSSTKEKSA
jgi:putative FmdB family regulatory protein